jgi:hypothetical protein
LFPSTFAGRAVPSGRCRLHGPSRSDVSPAWAPTLSAGPSLRFFVASRLDSFLAYPETPPARVIRGRLSFAHVPGPLPGLLSRPGRVSYARRRSWDLSFPSQCSSDLRAVTPYRPDRAHLPFRLPPTASFVVAGSHRLRLGHGWRGRGFWASRAPSSQPCRVIRRPRHGFYAQGRSYSPARTALGFYLPLSGLRRRASGLHFWRPFRPGFSIRHPRRRCSDERRGAAAVPFGVVGGRRLADPGGVSIRTGTLSEVFAPSVKQPTALAVAHFQQRSERRRKLFI